MIAAGVEIKAPRNPFKFLYFSSITQKKKIANIIHAHRIIKSVAIY